MDELLALKSQVLFANGVDKERRKDKLAELLTT
jgi:hypothetical protein